MPEALKKSASVENGSVASSEVVQSGVEQCVGLVENKLRNLGKRKQRLEEKKKSCLKGAVMKPEEAEAVAKLGEVELLQESYTDFEKQMKSIASDALKKEKQETKSREAERRKADVARYRDLLDLRALLRTFHKHKAHFKDGSLGAPKLSVTEMAAMDTAETRFFPTLAHIPNDSADPSTAWDQLLEKAATDTHLLLSASPKVFSEPRLSFRDLQALLFHKLRSSALFSDEKIKAARPPKSKTQSPSPESRKVQPSEGQSETKAESKTAKSKSETVPSKTESAKSEIPEQEKKRRNRKPKKEIETEAKSVQSEKPVSNGPQQVGSSITEFQTSVVARSVHSPSALMPPSDIQFLQPDHIVAEAAQMHPNGVMMMGGYRADQLPLQIPPGAIFNGVPMTTGYGQVYGTTEMGGGELAVPRGPPSPIPLPVEPVPAPFVSQSGGVYSAGGRGAGEALLFQQGDSAGPPLVRPQRPLPPPTLLTLSISGPPLGLPVPAAPLAAPAPTAEPVQPPTNPADGPSLPGDASSVVELAKAELGLDSSMEWPSLRGAVPGEFDPDRRRGRSLVDRPASPDSPFAPTLSSTTSHPLTSEDSLSAPPPAVPFTEPARANTRPLDTNAPLFVPSNLPNSFLHLWHSHRALLDHNAHYDPDYHTHYYNH